MGKTFLAGDIGGTKALLMLGRVHGNDIEVIREERLSCAQYDSAEALIDEFLQDQPAPATACLAVAGPVEHTDDGDRARLTNLPWLIDTRVLQRHAGGGSFSLVNDMQALASGLSGLPTDSLYTLQAGRSDARAPAAVIAIGTGLGHAIIAPCNNGTTSLACEAGHADFAARDEQQWALAQFLRERHGHVARERVASGPGLVDIYHFLVARSGTDQDHEPGSAGNAAAAINEAARSGSDPLAMAAVNLLVDVLAGSSADLALYCLPRAGLYIAGGMAPHLEWILREERFLQRFLDKGRMSGLLADIPLHLVLEPRTGLLGAARIASGG